VSAVDSSGRTIWIADAHRGNGKRLLCVRMKSWAAFVELERGTRESVECNGRTIWIADAHRDDGKRFVVRADEKLTAFLELEAVISHC